MDLPVRHEGIFIFGSFRLDPVRRTLEKDGTLVKLPSRLFDTLLCLVANHHRLVERDELEQAVWPGRTVDAGSLGRAISSLREVLRSHGADDGTIVTATGRGYRLGSHVVFEPLEPAAPAILHPAILHDAAPVAPAASPGPPAGWLQRIRAPRQAAAWAVLLAACVAAWQFGTRRAPDGALPPFMPPPHTVAVMPFANLSGDPRSDYLADGLSEELINDLGSLSAVRVAAGTSSFSFKGRPAPIPAIARQLQVGTVLDGTVRRDGSRVRVAVQLVDGITGYQIWSHSYDRDQGDILSLEGQIADAVTESLKIVLLDDEEQRLRIGGTSNEAAYDAYLLGMAQTNVADPAAASRAIAAFSQAIRLDPGYALAYAQRSLAQAVTASYGVTDDPARTGRLFAAARQDAERSAALAPGLGLAHAALGYVLNCSLTGIRRAAAEYDQAVALSPGNATTLLGYARMQMQLGHMDKAMEAARHAAALDPLTPDTYRELAHVLAYAGRFGEAEQALARARTLPPSDPVGDRIAEGQLQTWKGDAAAAARACAPALNFRDNICLALAYHRLGRPADAQAALARAQQAAGQNAAFIYANIYADWGREQDALHWLAIAFRLRDAGLTYLKVTPTMASLAHTQLFATIERELDFPP